ncbi:MAG: ATP-binding protein [Bacteroidia bacterium]
MLKRLKNNTILLIVGGLLLLTAILLDLGRSNIVSPSLASVQAAKIQEAVLYKERISSSFLAELAAKGASDLYRQFDSYIRIGRSSDLLIFVYREGKLQLWSDNLVVPPAPSAEDTGAFTVQVYPNGLYMQRSLLREDGIAISLLAPIQFNFPIENKYLRNEIVVVKDDQMFQTTTEAAESDFTIESIEGEHLFYLRQIAGPDIDSFIAFLYFLGFCLVLFMVYRFISRLFSQGKFGKAWLSLSISLFVLVLFWKVFRLPEAVFGLSIFSPQYYASSFLFASLGDLIIFNLMLTWIVYMLVRYYPLPHFPSRWTNYLLFSILLFISFLGVYGIYLLFEGLILNSNISFDISNVYSLNWLSIAGFAALFLLFLDYVLFTLWVYRSYAATVARRKGGYAYFISAGILYLLVLIFTGFPDIFVFIYPLAMWLSLLLVVRYERHVYQFNFIILMLFLTSSFAAYELSAFSQRKELENQKLLASSLATERDVIAEYVFQDMLDRLASDNFVKSYFTSLHLGKEMLAKRFQQLYFSGYFGKYDAKVLTYGKEGEPFKESNILPLQAYLRNLQAKATPVIPNRLWFINDLNAVPSYIATIPVYRGPAELGQMLILLKQKAFFEESIYPELLLEKRTTVKEHLQNYSSAIYNHNKLVSQSGNYSYPVESNMPYDPGEAFNHWNSHGYSHLLHPVNPHTFVVVSVEEKNLLYPLATFSSLFLLFSAMLLVTFGLSFLLSLKPGERKELFRDFSKGDIHPFRNLLFSTKIRIATIFVIFISLLIIGFATSRYIRYRYNEEQNEMLSNKARGVLNRLETELNNHKISFLDNDALFAEVLNLSNLYQSDINLYNTSGTLITSSQPVIFERNLISGKMNGRAYFDLKYRKRSIAIQNENINRLEYRAAYAPIRNNERKVVAFLNLPFFSQETELKTEISSFLVTLINLYVFLFILVSFISIVISSTVTRPLAIIREKMRRTQIGKWNEMIDYKGEDEIGQLVQEYNAMLQELEISADKLARTEREGAWREMAKQVAHEIKNPLTPMKLNIQQLQRAWQNHPESLDKLLPKVTAILISQIDTLSQIATEFSAFAKMPEGSNEQLELNREIRDIAALYGNTRGITVTCTTEPHPVYIYADKNQFSRVLNNLVKNALQAIPENREGIIHLQLRTDGALVRLEITDNGVGIPPDKQEQIFTPNFSTKTSGMGLGLPIVKKIVENSGGTITFRSKPGKGSVFILVFPQHNARQETHAIEDQD